MCTSQIRPCNRTEGRYVCSKYCVETPTAGHVSNITAISANQQHDAQLEGHCVCASKLSAMQRRQIMLTDANASIVAYCTMSRHVAAALRSLEAAMGMDHVQHPRVEPPVSPPRLMPTMPSGGWSSGVQLRSVAESIVSRDPSRARVLI